MKTLNTTTTTTNKIKNLLSEGMTNTKTAKNKLKTFILYMSPYTQNSFGKNLCPKATTECANLCLFTAGRGIFSNVMNSRIAKSDYFLREKFNFLNQLADEIIKQYNKAKKEDYKVQFRLNGTTDIDFISLLRLNAGLDIETLKDYAIFYDYTKVLSYIEKNHKKENVFYTFSRSGENDKEIDMALNFGANISVVFNEVPKKWNGLNVIDGDKADDIMTELKGQIIGLKAKGKAKKNFNKFVVQL